MSGRCRGWVVYMFIGWGVGVKVMSVNSFFFKISFIGKSFVVIEVLFLSFMRV